MPKQRETLTAIVPDTLPPQLNPDTLDFPDIATAQRTRNGLVAVGGDLSVARLLAAYRQGVFPWYDQYHPILWWAFAERMVLPPHEIHISRSLEKALRNRRYCISVNLAFRHVIRRCARTYRPGQQGTWLTEDMQQAYTALHHAGHAHSFEYWYQDERQRWFLGGGLYGVQIGRMFFGESMFSHIRDASKMVLAHAAAHLRQCGTALIDCQLHTPHLASLGARSIPFAEFRSQLDHYCPQELAAPIGQGSIFNTCQQDPPPQYYKFMLNKGK